MSSIAVKDETREKVLAKIRRLQEGIAEKNALSRKATMDAGNKLIKDKREERLHWFEQSCIRMQGSALGIDQDAYEMKRRARLSIHERMVLIRRNRNAVLSGSQQMLLKPASFPRGEALYVGTNAVSDYVNPHKVTVAMSLQAKYCKETLEIVEREKRNIDVMLEREIQEMFNQFPKVISIVSQIRKDKFEKSKSVEISPHVSPNKSLRTLSNATYNSAKSRKRSGAQTAPLTNPLASLSLAEWYLPEGRMSQNNVDNTSRLSLNNVDNNTSLEEIPIFSPSWKKTDIKAKTRPGSRIIERSALPAARERSMSSRFDSSAVPLNLIRPVLPPLLVPKKS